MGIEDLDLPMSGIPGEIVLTIFGTPNFSPSTHTKEVAMIENRWCWRTLSSHGWLCRRQRCRVRQSGHPTPLALLLISLPVQAAAVADLIAAPNRTVFLAVPAHKQRSTHLAGQEPLAKLKEQIGHASQDRHSVIGALAYTHDAKVIPIAEPLPKTEKMHRCLGQHPPAMRMCVSRADHHHLANINRCTSGRVNSLMYLLLQGPDLCGGHLRTLPLLLHPPRRRGMLEIITEGYKLFCRQRRKIPLNELEYPAQTLGVGQSIDARILMALHNRDRHLSPRQQWFPS
jgi:hypothetical protein